jgi:hypothetical protein
MILTASSIRKFLLLKILIIIEKKESKIIMPNNQEIHTFSLGNTRKYQQVLGNIRKYYEIPGNTRPKT